MFKENDRRTGSNAHEEIEYYRVHGDLLQDYRLLKRIYREVKRSNKLDLSNTIHIREGCVLKNGVVWYRHHYCY